MEKIIINENDVLYMLDKLGIYDDCYSTGIVEVFKSYLEHRDFKQMRDNLERVPQDNRLLHELWDLDSRMGFLEVIYPC
jgi:hypothetical protein